MKSVTMDTTELHSWAGIWFLRVHTMCPSTQWAFYYLTGHNVQYMYLSLSFGANEQLLYTASGTHKLVLPCGTPHTVHNKTKAFSFVRMVVPYCHPHITVLVRVNYILTKQFYNSKYSPQNSNIPVKCHMMDTFVSRAFATFSMQLWREKVREICDDVMYTEGGHTGARAWPMQFVFSTNYFATVLSSSSSMDITKRASPLPHVST